MKSVVICEKPSQAANVRAAVGDEYGRVLAAQGHLLRLEEPHEVNPAWVKWTNDVLVPPSGRYGYRPDEGGGKAPRLAEIKAALLTADRVIIATDCDREGQAIGESLVRHFCFKGDVRRAMFTAEDQKSLKDAFAKAEPCARYRPLYDAAVARQQADQIYNLTLTRVASNTLRPAGWKQAIGIGRVKTPTLGIVCSREFEITEFVPRAFVEISATVAGEGGTAELWHRPRGETRLFDVAKATAISMMAKSYRGPLAVKRDSKRSTPPKPFDLPALQKWCGRWGWSAKKVLDTAQSLYETHKITSYPRAETRFLPESLKDQAPDLLAALRAIRSFTGVAPPNVELRAGKGAVYSDKGIAGASHHAIIPNRNVADRFGTLYGALNDDERKLFDLIARGWLAAVSPDHQYDETVMSFSIVVDGRPYEFSVKGRVETVAGWQLVFGTETEDDKDEPDAAPQLPPFADGGDVEVRATRVVSKMTTAPQRYSEGDLIDAMKNAWRFVMDPAERDRLKDAKGIGTPATRDTVIEGLKAQGMVSVEKGKLRPTEVGLWLYKTLRDAAPELVDPGVTARMESRLDAVLDGGATVDGVVGEVVARATAIVESIVKVGAASARPSVKREPTPKMLEAARAKAKRDGKRLPKGLTDDFDACRAYLGPLPEKTGDGPRLASDKQLGLIKSLVAKGQPAPAGFPAAVAMDVARNWIDTALAAQKAALR